MCYPAAMWDDRFKKTLFDLSLVLAVTAAVYAGALNNGFSWDDIYLVVKNPFIKGWENLSVIFTSGYWASIGKTGGLYRPLAMLSFMAEHSLVGLDPFLFHIDNVLLHFACSALVYTLTERYFRDRPAALFAALVFAAHPVHVESVAWVSGRAELLASFFLLASFLTSVQPPRRLPRNIVSPLFYLLGMLAKESAAVLPLLVLVHLVLVERERSVGRLAKALAPYALVLLVYIPVRLLVLPGEPTPPQHIFIYTTGYQRLLVMVVAVMQYVRLCFFPTDLRVLYVFAPPYPLGPQVLASLAVMALVVILSFRLARISRPALFFVLWFFLALLPVSNIIPTEVIMTERAMYLPLTGFCAAAGLLVSRAGKAFPPKAAVAFFAAVVLCLGLLSAGRVGRWKDNPTVHAELAEINLRLIGAFPGYVKSYLNLSQAYMVMGRPSDAERTLREAAGVAPDDKNVRSALAAVYKEQGKYGLALRELEAAGRLGLKGDDEYLTNLAALLYLTKGDTKLVEGYLLRAMELNPRGARQRLNYGYLLLDRGDAESALRYFREAGELDPGLYEAFLQQGVLLGGRGDYGLAAEALKKAVRLEPERPEAYIYLGAAFEALGMRVEAREAAQRAVGLAPGDEGARRLYDITR